MLKKIISLLLLLLLTGCDKEGISANLYVNSIGFDYKDEYIVYLYAASGFNEVLNEMQNDDTNPQIGKAKGKGIADCITQLETSMYERINYGHIKTVMFSKDFVDEKRMEEVILYFGNSHQFSIDSYFFITEDIEDVYSVKSIDKASADNSLFLNPELNTSLFDNVSFVTFVSSFYEEYRGIRFPVLKVKEGIWSNGDNKKVLIIDEIMYFNKGKTYYGNEEYLHYISKFDSKKISIDDLVIHLTDYSLDIQIIEGNTILNAKANASIVINKDDLSDMQVVEIIEKEIDSQLQKVVELNKTVDVLNVNDYLYRRGRDFSTNYIINVNIQK